MKRNKSKKRAVSPIIAVLLLIAIAVAAAILVYVWTIGVTGVLTAGLSPPPKEQLVLDAYYWQNKSGAPIFPLTLYFRNVGSTDVVLDAIYVSGTRVTSSIGTVVSVQSQPVSITVTNFAGLTLANGNVYTLKCVTKTGVVFTFSIIYGRGV